MTHCGLLWRRSVARPELPRFFPAESEHSRIELGVSNKYAFTPACFRIVGSQLHFTVLRPSAFKISRDHGPRCLRSAFCVDISSEFLGKN